MGQLSPSPLTHGLLHHLLLPWSLRPGMQGQFGPDGPGYRQSPLVLGRPWDQKVIPVASVVHHAVPGTSHGRGLSIPVCGC